MVKIKQYVVQASDSSDSSFSAAAKTLADLEHINKQAQELNRVFHKMLVKQRVIEILMFLMGLAIGLAIH